MSSHLVRIVPPLLLILALAGCGTQNDDPAKDRAARAAASHGDILIGATFNFGERGLLLKEGIELAVDEVNREGGALGRKIRIVWEDDKGTLRNALYAVRGFINNKDVVAVISGAQPYICFISSPYYEFNGILVMLPLFSYDCFSHNDYRRVFRNIPDTKAFGEATAKFFKDTHVGKVAIYQYDPESFATGSLADAWEFETGKYGIETVDREGFDEYGGIAQFRSVLKRWKNNYAIDALLFGGGASQAEQFVQQMDEVGLHVPVLGGIGMDDPTLQARVGKSGCKLFTTTLYDFNKPVGRLQGFVDAFKTRFGKDPDVAAAQGYEALKILAQAVSRAGTTVPDQVAKTLRDHKEWQGLTGDFSFDEDGNIIGKEVMVKPLQ